jgi:hypothetical protein
VIIKGKDHLGNQGGVAAPTHASGAVAVQYVIKLVLVAIVTMSAAGALGGKVSDIFSTVSIAIS